MSDPVMERMLAFYTALARDPTARFLAAADPVFRYRALREVERLRRAGLIDHATYLRLARIVREIIEEHRKRSSSAPDTPGRGWPFTFYPA